MLSVFQIFEAFEKVGDCFMSFLGCSWSFYELNNVASAVLVAFYSVRLAVHIFRKYIYEK